MTNIRSLPRFLAHLAACTIVALAVSCSSGGSGTDAGSSEDTVQPAKDGQSQPDVSVPSDAQNPEDALVADAGFDAPAPDAPDVCAPDCVGRVCGSDGCNGSCGTCPADDGYYCTADGHCNCQPETCDTWNVSCGQWNDGCGGVVSCGECNEFPNAFCNGGTCACKPDCADKTCGSDGCGASCGQCVCGNGLCEEMEDYQGCKPDCGFCGDGVCGAGEDETGPAGTLVCMKDCGPVCGDELCELGETNQECPYDCPMCGDGVCSPGEQNGGCFFECPPSCGDGQCVGFFETPANCPQDCPPVCGDGACAPPENLAGCPGDCALCGDGICSSKEDQAGCPGDCLGQCGNGICEGSESPDQCAVDCGFCGDGTCGFIEEPGSCTKDCAGTCGDGECGDDETEDSCPADCGCLPDCSGKECGLDECGFDCGSCSQFAACGEDNQCHCQFLECGQHCCSDEAICVDELCCLPDCSGLDCGTDGCLGSCGDCPELKTCQQGHCVCQFQNCQGKCCQQGQTCSAGKCCTPDCDGKACGDNGCGSSCGNCGFAHECEAGQCVWQVFCGNKECEPGAGENCQTCPQDCACGNNAVCQASGACCQLQCGNKECGPDGCGGVCGECAELSTCTAGVCKCDFQACADACCQQGQVCHASACCKPDCSGKECGDDGCGGSCGECPDGFSCSDFICQCDNIIWTRNHGEKDSDLIYGVSLADEGYYFGGRTQSTLEYHNFWAVKVNLDGYKQWSQDYTGSGSFSKDIAFGVATTPDGDLVAVGKQDTGLWYSGVARKFAPDGTNLWGKTFGGNGLNEFRDVVVTDSGVSVMVGQTFSGYTYKGWLVALNPDGSTNGSKTYTASGAFDVLRGIEKVSAGGFVAVGCSGLQSIDNDDYVSPGQMWLVRLDNSFNLSWSAKLHNSSEGFAVAETADGFVVVGYTWNGSNRDIVVVRTDASGTKMWEQVFGWGGDDVAQDVLVTPNNSYLVTGYAQPPGKSDQDLILFDMSQAGAVLWQTFAGSSGTQAGYSLAPVPGEPGSYIAAGRNSNDGWLVKFSSCY